MATGSSNFADTTTLTYVALKQLNVNGAVRQIGAAVPEAGSWRNLSNYISSGYIAVVGLATGGHPGVPSGKAARTKIGRPEGNKEFTHYRPVSPDGVPSTVPSDAP